MLETFERKMLYAFLATLFQKPDEQTLAAAQGIEEATFEAVFPGLSVPPVPPLPELRAAHARLFSGKDSEAPVPPYGCVFLEKKPKGKGHSTKLVAGLYKSAGLDPEQSPEPADYLPTELEFLYYLSEGEQRSREKGEDAAARRWVASQADFFHNFFSPWVGRFCDRIAGEGEAHPFYLWAAELLRRFVELERKRLKAT